MELIRAWLYFGLLPIVAPIPITYYAVRCSSASLVHLCPVWDPDEYPVQFIRRLCAAMTTAVELIPNRRLDIGWTQCKRFYWYCRVWIVTHQRQNTTFR